MTNTTELTPNEQSLLIEKRLLELGYRYFPANSSDTHCALWSKSYKELRQNSAIVVREYRHDWAPSTYISFEIEIYLGHDEGGAYALKIWGIKTKLESLEAAITKAEAAFPQLLKLISIGGDDDN